jgi:hypothetical protein
MGPAASPPAFRAAAHRTPRMVFVPEADHPPMLKKFVARAETGGMVNFAFGIGVAVAIVLAFWLLIGFIDELQQTRRTLR